MTKPIIVVKVPCKLLYVIQVKETEMFNFLALLDIRVFGHLWLLIGLALLFSI